MDAMTALDLRDQQSSLTVRVLGEITPAGGDGFGNTWLSVRIEAHAERNSGDAESRSVFDADLASILMLSDFHDFSMQVRDHAEFGGSAEMMLGGERTVGLRLRVVAAPAVADHLARETVSVYLTPSALDPYPSLSFLLDFDERGAFEGALGPLDAVIERFASRHTLDVGDRQDGADRPPPP